MMTFAPVAASNCGTKCLRQVFSLIPEYTIALSVCPLKLEPRDCARDSEGAAATPASVTDFWRRWHMTLSRFLRDFLYISLGGNRHGKFRTHLNLMLTMLLGGLWHGA